MTHRQTEQPLIRLEDEMRALLPVAEACKHLSIDPNSFRVSALRGQAPVPTVKIGRRTWIRTNDLRALAGLAPIPDSVGGAA
jgi:hypothetical protein